MLSDAHKAGGCSPSEDTEGKNIHFGQKCISFAGKLLSQLSLVSGNLKMNNQENNFQINIGNN